MPLKKSVGNMYDWVTHIHTHLAGECPHKCSYCYVQKMCRTNKYKGSPRLIESELDVGYSSGRIIFIEHMSDLFAEDIWNGWKIEILRHCNEYPMNCYVFQTKNPEHAFGYYLTKRLPEHILFGTTIETNRLLYTYSEAPSPVSRLLGMRKFKEKGIEIFVTIEPIMNFDIDILTRWMVELRPSFINIGADSKNCKLPEPSKEKILEFIEILQKNKINIKKKSNLGRLLK